MITLTVSVLVRDSGWYLKRRKVFHALHKKKKKNRFDVLEKNIAVFVI